jgi:hypothetical protein
MQYEFKVTFQTHTTQNRVLKFISIINTILFLEYARLQFFLEHVVFFLPSTHFNI